MITPNMPLAEIVKIFPKSIEIFNQDRIDYCCGGKHTLEDALQEKKLDINAYVSMLNQEMANYDEDQKSRLDKSRYLLPVDELIDVIVKTHHVDERKMIAQLDQLVNKILIVHFEEHSEELLKVHRLFSDLKKELEEHFVKEEKVVFPLMIQIQNQAADSKKAFAYIKELEEEHEAAGELIKELQAVTRDFTPPKDVCPTYIGTYETMKRLVEDIFMHIYYESSVLFPKVEALVK